VEQGRGLPKLRARELGLGWAGGKGRERDVQKLCAQRVLGRAAPALGCRNAAGEVLALGSAEFTGKKMVGWPKVAFYFRNKCLCCCLS